ncbi:MAG: RNA polymerase sigma factor [Actinomycetota bacterium]|nr:RNA polymerase sigma factor [Actinomycetota bacterium]
MPFGDRFEPILAAARAGAEWAWREVYADLAPVVLGYLRGQQATSPEDVTGEVFLQVVRDLHCFQGSEGNFRSWVFTIAHHRLLDERRRRRRRPSEPTADVELERHLGAVESEPAALDALVTGEIVDLLARLSPDQCEVLLLRLVAGLTIEEVAAAVGKRPGAVKALQHRGLKALRRHLSDHPHPFSLPQRSPA